MLNISDDVVAPQLHHYHHRISLPARNGGRISHVLVVAFPAVTTHAQVHGLCHHVILSHSRASTLLCYIMDLGHVLLLFRCRHKLRTLCMYVYGYLILFLQKHTESIFNEVSTSTS